MRLAIVLLSVLATGFVSVGYADTPNVSSAEKAKIESVVHDYLLKNPEIIMQAVQVLQTKQMQETRKSFDKTQSVAAKFTQKLFQNASDPMIGNANGTVTIAEFFDYQCVHCVEMEPVIASLIKANTNLRVIFKEFPI